MRRFFRCALLALVFGVFLVNWHLHAQSPTAALVGIIRDSSGAVVPEARIKVRNMETNGMREVPSDHEGRFVVSNLDPGRYEAVIEKSGFQTLRETAVEVQVDQTVRLELTLKVGSVAETVEVTAQAPLINTENGTKGDVMLSREIVELPLNGRNFTDLVFLVPGVNQTGQGDTGSAFAMGGARNDNTNYLIDGISARRPEFGQTSLSPNLDVIQEFKVSTSNYSAEYGQLSGGVINVALKSGSNQLHGSLFEFLRNDKLDARNFFSAAVPELRQNQFGGSLNGPVVVPKVYNGHDRTFFMFSWESYRNAAGNNGVSRVPTALERAGDFSKTIEAGGKSAQVKNPFGTGNFPGNIIPASLISPISAKIVPFWPMPNQFTQANNYLAYASNHSPWDSFMTKIDQRLSSKDTIAVRYQHVSNHNESPFGSSPLGKFGSHTDSATQMIGLSYVRLFTPTLIQELRGGLYRTVALGLPLDAGTDVAAQLGISGISPSDPVLLGSPAFTVTGLAMVGDNIQWPTVQTTNDYSYSDTWTWVRNAHEIKFGGNLIRTQNFQPNYNNIRGSFTFNGNWTTDSFADFLLGLMNGATRETVPPHNYMFSTSYGLFAQDNYKITQRLTLNLGLRWDVNGLQYDKFGRYAGFIPEYGKIIAASDRGMPNFAQLIAAAGATNLVALASDYDVPQSLIFTRHLNMAPRFGLAWRPWGGTRTVVRGGYGLFYGTSMFNPLTNMANSYPFTVSESVNRVASNPTAISFANPFANAIQGSSLNVFGVQFHASTPYVQSWNLTIERQLGNSISVEAGYSGSKGTHLGLSSDLNRPFYSAQYQLPNGSFLRPYPQYNNSVNFFNFAGNSSYNSGTVTLRRRFAGGIFFSVNYVYSKSIDDGSVLGSGFASSPHAVQDPRNLRLEWGRSNFDSPHSFAMSYSYPIPWHGTSRLRWILGGWQLAGSGRARTGQPFTPNVTGVNLALGGALHPDRTAKGTLASPTVQDWFNLAGFPLVPNNIYRMGTSGRNVLDGPGLSVLNFSLLHNVRIREGRQIQFRWEAFNATNHPNFGLPATAMNTLTAGTITSAGTPRQMQVGLRYQF